MIFKMWSDTNMMNACTRLEVEGFGFKADLNTNTITVEEDVAEATVVVKDEGGEEYVPQSRPNWTRPVVKYEDAGEE